MRVEGLLLLSLTVGIELPDDGLDDSGAWGDVTPTDWHDGGPGGR